MTSTQFWVMAIEALLVTIPAVLIIPRARQSPLFDRVLWVATWLLAFLCAWSAPGYIAADSALNNLVIADVTLIPTLLGAIVGALALNALLWLMDRFGGPPLEENVIEEEPMADEEKNDGESSNSIGQ